METLYLKIKELCPNKAQEIINLIENEKIGLEQAYLFSILQPLLQIQGTQEFTDTGIIENVSKEKIAAKIIEIINTHAKVRIKELEKSMKKLKEE